MSLHIRDRGSQRRVKNECYTNGNNEEAHDVIQKYFGIYKKVCQVLNSKDKEIKT